MALCVFSTFLACDSRLQVDFIFSNVCVFKATLRVRVRGYLYGCHDWPSCLRAASMCVSSQESWASSALLFQRNWRRLGGNYTPLLRLVKTSSNQVFLLQKQN